jgi:D-glycero-D-manno-heptose 1,7-bisphosphate phosphatase
MAKTSRLDNSTAVFIDRDGTLNRMVYDPTHGLLDSPRLPDQVSLMPGAAPFLRKVRELGARIVVVTNQPGLAKGWLTLEGLQAVHERLGVLLKAEGAAWDALYYCPHHPEGCIPRYSGPCDCRKPAPGLILRAGREAGIRLESSWMIGDGLNDIQAGRAAGCRTILLTQLKLEQVERFFQLDQAMPDHIVADFKEAFRRIAGQIQG